MKIYIPTYGRASKQSTLEWLSRSGLAATLVVQAREATAYAPYANRTELLILPDHIRTISPTRQFIMETAYAAGQAKICMLDDDLIFFKRKAPTEKTSLSYSLQNTNDDEIKDIFDTLSKWLDEVPHCGVSGREGNNRVEKSHADITRMMRCLAYRVDIFFELGLRFDRLDIKEDFDVTLQFLRAGYPNRVSYIYAHNQANGSGAAGGCAEFRDHAMMERCSHELAALHPGFVKVRTVETKGSFGGGARTDVICYWGRAYASSKAAESSKIIGFE